MEDGNQFQTEFVRKYLFHLRVGREAQGAKAQGRDKKDWFSLEELSERLVKLRKMEEEERKGEREEIG